MPQPGVNLANKKYLSFIMMNIRRLYFSGVDLHKTSAGAD